MLLRRRFIKRFRYTAPAQVEAREAQTTVVPK